MTKSPSRKYHHGDLRHALVEAGLDILAEEGLEALSLRAIAARAGVSHAAPKNHFGSLRGLLTAIGAEGFRRHAASMRAGLRDGASRRERMIASLEGYVDFAQRNPALFQLMMSKTYCDFADPELAEAARGSYAVLADIATGLDWDKADAEGAQTRAEMLLWSIAHGYAMLSLNGQFGENRATRAPVYRPSEILPDFGYRDG